MNADLKKVYSGIIDKHYILLKKVNRFSRTISLLRLALFIMALILIYVFADSGQVSALIITIFFAISIFIFLVKYHSKILTDKKKNEAIIQINKEELEAISGKFQVFENGDEFLDPQHPYSIDVDVFGEGSLFQFLNRSASIIGKERLAKNLCFPKTNKGKIIRNQEAVKELSEMLEWRQSFQATKFTYKEKPEDSSRILDWVIEPPLFKSPVYTILVFLIPLLSAFMITLVSLGNINANLLFIYLLIPWGISGSFTAKVNRRHSMVSKTSEMLLKYATLLDMVETNKFSSIQLIKLQNKLKSNNISSGKIIKQLYSILSALDNRINFISWALFNGLLLWDILQMIRLEKWQEDNQSEMNEWFDVIAEIDALNSFSNFHFNNPDTNFPELQSQDYIIKAENLGHPLISRTTRIDNDISICKNEFFIITGANMAGKSTFLRTLVTNMILAMCGAPVCAKKMEFHPIQIFTSIRTNDSLHKNESYFYSELKRLKLIMDELKSGKVLFVVLDEILKGTNSKDKHAGSEALLKQFISLKTSGIVATHDVALGQLANTFPDDIKNRCFEVDINGSALSFDYKIREGVSKNMNATILMKEMGITI